MTMPRYQPPAPPTYGFNPPNPVTPPAGYTIDGNGNLQLMPGYYTDNNGNTQLIPTQKFSFDPMLTPPNPVSPMPFDPISDVPRAYPASRDPYSDPNKSVASGYNQEVAPGYSQDDIRAFVNANIGDPAKIQDAMIQYGVGPNQIAQAMGVEPSVVTSYFTGNNMPAPQTAYPEASPVPTYPPFDAPKEQPSTYYPAPNPDMSQLATLPNGSQVYTGQ
jgi:hypothetical protein